MLQSQNRLFQNGILLSDLALIAIGVFLGSSYVLPDWIWLAQSSDSLPSLTLLLQQTLCLAIAWWVVALRMSFYQSRRTSMLRAEISSLAEAWLTALALGSVLALSIWGFVVFQPVVTFAVTALGIAGLRIMVRMALRRLRGMGLNYRRFVLVGHGHSAKNLAEQVQDNQRFGVRISGRFTLPGEIAKPVDGVTDLGDASNLQDYLESQPVDALVLCPSDHVSPGITQKVLNLCDEAGIQCYFSPDFIPLRNLNSSFSWLGNLPAFTFRSGPFDPMQLMLKRAMDVVGSGFGLLLCFPALVAIALIIKLQDGGPIFFYQERVGKDGRPFRCYKFRSMGQGAEAQKQDLLANNEQDGPVFKMKSDPRITRMGRFLRKYSLDELPQLWNILRGDMSLVGPRPPVPAEVKRYEWWQRRRISVRPGLTCVWQVWGRNKVSFQRWVEMDLYYIDNWSLWLDVKLVLHTLRTVFTGSGM